MDRKILNGIGATANFFQSILLLVIRLYWGFLFFIGGYFKLSNLDSVMAYFNQIGLYGGLAKLVGLTELFCGILLFFGFLSRLAALATTILMFGAYLTAHPEQWNSFLSDPQFFISSPNFSFLFASLIILFFGPGIFSIDAIIKKKIVRSSTPFDDDQHDNHHKDEDSNEQK